MLDILVKLLKLGKSKYLTALCKGGRAELRNNHEMAETWSFFFFSEQHPLLNIPYTYFVSTQTTILWEQSSWFAVLSSLNSLVEFDWTLRTQTVSLDCCAFIQVLWSMYILGYSPYWLYDRARRSSNTTLKKEFIGGPNKYFHCKMPNCDTIEVLAKKCIS